MKRHQCSIAASLLLAAITTFHLQASDNTWNNASGNATWDTTSANWVSPTVWVDGYGAIFGATGAGSVTLGTPITVGNQTFNAAGYTIFGGSYPLTLAGPAPTITLNANATNAAGIYGTNGLTIQGTNILMLSGDVATLDGNHYTGGTFIKGGTVILGVQGASPNTPAYALDSIEQLDAGAVVRLGSTFDGSQWSGPAQGQIGYTAGGKLHMTGGTFDLYNDPKNQYVPIPEGTGLIINNGPDVQAGLEMYADGKDHVFSGVIADGNNGQLIGDNSGQGPGYQIGIVNINAGISGGTWTLTASNTYSGSTRLQTASLRLAGNGTMGFPTTNGLTGPLRIYGTNFLDLNGCNQTIANMQNGAATAQIYNSAVGTVSTLTFGYGNEAVSRTCSYQFIDNPGTGGILAMTKVGHGNPQTLNGVNTYSGDTTVLDGNLIFGAASAVSSNSAFRLSTGAMVSLNYSDTANVRQLWINSVQQPNGVYGAGTPGIDPASTGTLTVTGSSLPNTWKNGSGNFTWDTTSANWTSPTIWANGDNALFGATGAGTVTLGEPITVDNQTFSAPGYTIDGAGGDYPLTLAGASPTIIVNANATNAASLSGTNGLTVQGTATLTLLGNLEIPEGNHYTGGTYVKSGTLVLGVVGASQNGSAYAVDSIEALDAGATVRLGSTFDGTTWSGPAQGQIGYTAGGKLHMTGGTFDLYNDPKNQYVPIPEGTGLIINNGPDVQAGLEMYADGKDHVFSGVIADGNNGQLVGDNSGQGPGYQIGIVNINAGISGGTWTLTASNSYSGSTRLQTASLRLAGNGTMGFPTANGLTGPLRIYGTNFLDLNGHNQTIANMQNGAATAQIYNSAVGTVSTLTFGYGNEAVSRTCSYQFIDNPGTGGILAMTKVGHGNPQTLNGVNTYSGDTTVLDGNLIFGAASAVSSNSAFRLSTGAMVSLNYSDTANVRQLWINGVQQPNGVYGAGTPGIDPASTGTLTVTGYAPATLGVSHSGNSLTFSWQGVYKLQSKTNIIVGSWFDYPGGSTSPVNVPINHTNRSVFFRLSSY